LPSLRVKGPYLAMVTLAFGIVVEKLVGEWTDVFGGAQGIYGIKALTWDGQPLTSLQWVWLGIGLCAATHLLLRNLLQGRFGRALLSLQADEIASSSVGVRVYRAKVIAFVVAAVTCGIAGALVAQQNQYINSDFITFHLSIFILLLVLFGGAGSQYGPLVGTVILTVNVVLLSGYTLGCHSMRHAVGGFLDQLSRHPVRSHSLVRTPSQRLAHSPGDLGRGLAPALEDAFRRGQSVALPVSDTNTVRQYVLRKVTEALRSPIECRLEMPGLCERLVDLALRDGVPALREAV